MIEISNEQLKRRDAMQVDIIDNQCIAMQSAVIAGHLESPAAGLQWIVNTLRGPGLLPDLDVARSMGGAQAWFDAQSAESSALRARRHAALFAEAESTNPECHGLDTPDRVRFYEHDFYVFSNFSAFSIKWQGRRFATSEHAYHWEKFAPGTRDEDGLFVRDRIIEAYSAHDAFKLAEGWKPLRRPDWDVVKVGIMRAILHTKALQHPYVLRKLLATGNRELVEDSWRDPFWGWGPNRDGQNMLGKLWMEVRAEIRAEQAEAVAA